MWAPGLSSTPQKQNSFSVESCQGSTEKLQHIVSEKAGCVAEEDGSGVSEAALLGRSLLESLLQQAEDEVCVLESVAT